MSKRTVTTHPQVFSYKPFLNGLELLGYAFFSLGVVGGIFSVIINHHYNNPQQALFGAMLAVGSALAIVLAVIYTKYEISVMHTAYEKWCKDNHQIIPLSFPDRKSDGETHTFIDADGNEVERTVVVFDETESAEYKEYICVYFKEDTPEELVVEVSEPAESNSTKTESES